MNKRLRKLIVKVCDFYPKNVFSKSALANDVIYELERKARKKFDVEESFLAFDSAVCEINDMMGDKSLASKETNGCVLQTPKNLIAHHGWTIPKD